MGETILVVRTEDLKKHVDFQGFLPLDADSVQKLYESIDVISMDRDAAEEDPTYKQLVAYSAIHCDETWLTYLRGKDLGEARLHGSRSMGIGGHIEAGDHANLFLDDHLKVAAYREVDEEIAIAEEYELRLAGLINDDSNAVGEVHVGLVYVADVEQKSITKRERGIAQLKFMTPDELTRARAEFETWSQILVDNLHKLQ